MKNVLIPIDGTERSIKSITLAKKLFQPGDVKIRLLMIREDVIAPVPSDELDPAVGRAKELMDKAAAMLSDYDVTPTIIFGRAGEDILKCAKKDGTDIIIMTKSTKKGWIQAIGSVTAYVVKYSPCMVLIVPEQETLPD
jgi:nucleotide-binding universal stress UspA family protein